ncbi:DUF397 domain-containing protein [Micromonospora sp. WMMD1082]|uniref:DUF397 domain-containing protein n=1 Tax=Micromonospora sp. WMMD1082 TaxID=3016104 RepID=UPI0024166BA2|nr:DUF397 domain-containing protein [Micromonospora sp. WMMD1082]MDG4798720.1 DUF397 domain-containing protein [Micromonospora sp. WMMD1082]
MRKNEWTTSTRSGNNGACVEVRDDSAVVGVRDSKDPAGPVLTFGPVAWAAFTGAVKGDALTR